MMNSKVEALIQTCASGNVQQQVMSIEELVELKADEAIPMLIDLLSSQDPTVRFTAIQALVQLGAEQEQLVGAEVIKLVSDSEEIVRSEAIDSLGILGYGPALEVVKSALIGDASALVRASAAETLGDIGEPSVLGSLERSLNDPDESVRAYSANSFGLLADSSKVPILETYLSLESSIRVKAEILGAQYRLGLPKACESLMDLLNTADDDLAPSLLNILDDLFDRKKPASLTADIMMLRNALSALAQRLPIHRAHVEALIKRLEGVSMVAETN